MDQANTRMVGSVRLGVRGSFRPLCFISINSLMCALSLAADATEDMETTICVFVVLDA